MLSLMAFPLATSAADDNRTSFDYLNDEEQIYVTRIRLLITQAKDKVDVARTDLQTFFLQDYRAWYARFLAELDAVDAAIYNLKQVSAPPDFSAFGQQCQSMAGLPPDSADLFLSPDIVIFTLVEAAQTLAIVENNLNQLEQRLDNLNASLDKRIEEVAEAQKRGEELLDDFLSCQARPARPY
jgi:hypothetical protein